MKKDVICPLCTKTYKVEAQKSLSIFNLFQVAFMGSSLYILTSLSILQVMAFSLPLIPIIDIFKRIKYRRSISCHTCGFDPAWYKRDVNVAKDKVLRFTGAKADLKLVSKLD